MFDHYVNVNSLQFFGDISPLKNKSLNYYKQSKLSYLCTLPILPTSFQHFLNYGYGNLYRCQKQHNKTIREKTVIKWNEMRVWYFIYLTHSRTHRHKYIAVMQTWGRHI